MGETIRCGGALSSGHDAKIRRAGPVATAFSVHFCPFRRRHSKNACRKGLRMPVVRVLECLSLSPKNAHCQHLTTGILIPQGQALLRGQNAHRQGSPR